MTETVITMGKRTEHVVIRGVNEIPTGDYRDFRIQCRFSEDAVNGGAEAHTPQPKIRVRWAGTVAPSAVAVEVTSPGGQPERLYSTSHRSAIGWTRPVSNNAVRAAGG